jgi:2'-5' RNA ligase
VTDVFRRQTPRKEETFMKHVTIDRKNAASAEVPVEELTPQSGPPAERYTHRIVLNVFGKRFELTRHTAVRVISKGPAKVIEMPIRTTIES